MDNLSNISETGWIVILILGSLLLVFIFLIIWFKGVRAKKGDTELAFGNSTDKKIAKFRKELEKQKQAEKHDDELRKQLYRKSLEIDDRMKADMRRVVRSMNEEIYVPFQEYMKCDFPAAQVKTLIKDELFQCIDENHLREKLRKSEISGYLADVLRGIEKEYELFTAKIGRITCGEAYPAWNDIEESISILVFNWASKMKEVLISRMNEKITLYQSERDHFLLAEFKTNSVDEPIDKNRRYLSSIEEEIHERP